MSATADGSRGLEGQTARPSPVRSARVPPSCMIREQRSASTWPTPKSLRAGRRHGERVARSDRGSLWPARPVRCGHPHCLEHRFVDSTCCESKPWRHLDRSHSPRQHSCCCGAESQRIRVAHEQHPEATGARRMSRRVAACRATERQHPVQPRDRRRLLREDAARPPSEPPRGRISVNDVHQRGGGSGGTQGPSPPCPKFGSPQLPLGVYTVKVVQLGLPKGATVAPAAPVPIVNEGKSMSSPETSSVLIQATGCGWSGTRASMRVPVSVTVSHDGTIVGRAWARGSPNLSYPPNPTGATWSARAGTEAGRCIRPVACSPISTCTRTAVDQGPR